MSNHLTRLATLKGQMQTKLSSIMADKIANNNRYLETSQICDFLSYDPIVEIWKDMQTDAFKALPVQERIKEHKFMMKYLHPEAKPIEVNNNDNLEIEEDKSKINTRSERRVNIINSSSIKTVMQNAKAIDCKVIDVA